MRALLIAVASIVLVVFALLVGPYVVPTSKFKGEIISGIGSFVKGDVYVGSFGFKILPYPKFTIKDLTVISREAPFQGMPFIKADVLEGGLSPNALMHGKIVADVTISNLLFDFRISDNGIKNTVIPFFEGPRAEKRSAGKLRSLRIENGTFYYVNGGKTRCLERIRFEAADIRHDDLISASVSMSALLKNEIPQSFNSSGLFSVNREQKIFELKRLDLYFAGARFNFEGILQYGTSPKSFDMHAATPSVNISSITPFVPALSSGLPMGFKAAGPMALDISLKGTKENTTFKIHADATNAEINSGSIFTKKTNFPFKIFVSGVYQPAFITIDDATFSFGSSSFKLAGSVVRQEGYPAQIRLEPTSFNSADVIPSFPILAVFEELSNPAASLEIRGPLLEEQQRIVNGRFSSEGAVVFGKEISNLNMDFSYAGGVFSFGSLKASLYGGTMSGNGQTIMGDPPSYRFDIVADNIDTSGILGAFPILSGTGSLVFKAETRGGDNISLSENLVSEGTIVVPQGEVIPFRLGRDILTQSIWNIIEPHVTQGLNSGMVEGLSAADGPVKDLKISFGSKGGILSVSKMSWTAPNYKVEAKLSISEKDVVDGEGDVFIDSDTVYRLIKDPADRKNVATADGRLDIPFTIGGALSSLYIRPSETKLANNLKGIETPPMIGPLRKEAGTFPSLAPAVPPAALAPLTVPGQVPAQAPAVPPIPPAAVPPAPALAPPAPAVPSAPPVSTPVPQAAKELAPVSPPVPETAAIPPPEVEKEAAPKPAGPAATEIKPETEKKEAPKKRAEAEKQKSVPEQPASRQKKTKMKGEVDEDVFKVLVGE
jgi:hypothetical protein